MSLPPVRTQPSLAMMPVPLWSVVVLLSPMIAFAIALALDEDLRFVRAYGRLAWVLGPILAVAGSGIGGLLKPGTKRRRLLTAAGGAAFGFCGFWSVLVAAILFSHVLK